MKLLDGIATELDAASRRLLNARVMAERGDLDGQTHALEQLAEHAEHARHTALTAVLLIRGKWPMEEVKPA